jgi:hypothetical protein
MFRKAFIAIAATAALGVGLAGMTSSADAMYKKRHHHHNDFTIAFGFGVYPFYDYGYGYPRYSILDDHYAYDDCIYRRVPVKKWNKAHTHRYIVYRKRLVCY